jgi:hypothetical protein
MPLLCPTESHCSPLTDKQAFDGVAGLLGPAGLLGYAGLNASDTQNFSNSIKDSRSAPLLGLAPCGESVLPNQ